MATSISNKTILAHPNHLAEGAGICLRFRILLPAHSLPCLHVPLRSIWAVWNITSSLKQAAQNKSLKDFKLRPPPPWLVHLLSSSEDLDIEQGDLFQLEQRGWRLGQRVQRRYRHRPPTVSSMASLSPTTRKKWTTLREILEVRMPPTLRPETRMM